MKFPYITALQHDLAKASRHDGGMADGTNKKPPGHSLFGSMIDGMGAVTSSMIAGVGLTGATMRMAARLSMATMDLWIGTFTEIRETGMQATMDMASASPYWKMYASEIDRQFEDWYDKQMARRHTDLKDRPDHWIYDYDKYKLKDEMEFLPDAVQTVTKTMIRYNWHIQSILERDGVAGVLREISKYDRHPGGALYQKKYNKKFLNEHADGSVHEVTPDDIVKMFPRANAREIDDFPRIIISASHARGEEISDMKSITHGIEAMARDASGSPLPIASMDQHPGPNQTVTLFACDTERTMGLNAARLIDRHRELKHNARTGEKDQFIHISPAAKRIAKLMLKCMVKDPSLIDVESDWSLQQLYNRGDIEGPIELRPQAARIAQHFQLIGYSKGGNVVSDAMRYLVSEMQAKIYDQPLIVIRDEKDHLLPVTKLYGERGIKSIVRNIGCMSIAAREVGMSDEMQENGVRRVALNNRFDRIGFHSHYDDKPHDENWVIEGKEIGFGHTPQEAMGTRNGLRGYLTEDPRVERRLKEIMAPHYGKATVSRIAFVDGYTDDKGKPLHSFVRMDTAQGTTEKAFDKHRRQVVKALLDMKLGPVNIESGGADSRQYILKIPKADFFNNPQHIKALQKAFATLRENAPGLVIAQRILDEDLPRQIAAVKAAGRTPGESRDEAGSHAARVSRAKTGGGLRIGG